MLALPVSQIGAVMGLEPLPNTYAELDLAIMAGIRKTALRFIVSHLVERRDQILPLMHRIVPEGTLKRRKGRLSPEESERAERLARVYATAVHVLESADDARRFLHTPHPMLEAQQPLDVALTEIGAQRVERILWSLHYGLAA